MHIWINSPTKTVAQALEYMLSDFCKEVSLYRKDSTELALWDLTTTFPFPYAPKTIPTLALISKNKGYELQVLKQRYRGYLSAEDGVEQLKQALRVVRCGEIWAPRSVLSQLVRGYKQETLTRREQQIRDLIVQGLSNKAIASQLAIAEPTVKTHVSNIFIKCEVGSRTELVAHHLQVA